MLVSRGRVLLDAGGRCGSYSLFSGMSCVSGSSRSCVSSVSVNSLHEAVRADDQECVEGLLLNGIDGVAVDVNVRLLHNCEDK